jgi:hypothetical protein
MKKKLDQDEKEILSQYERGALKSVVTSEVSLRRYREYARATLAKNQGGGKVSRAFSQPK